MQEHEALSQMIAPSQVRPGKPRGGVIQLLVTSNCDKSCFGCTQASNLRRPKEFMPPDLFETAVLSLKNYWGIVGVFGGNPAVHGQFETLCEILRAHIPKERCGLWCNNPLGKGAVMRDTFNPAVSNLNVHLDQKAYDEFRQDWPECHPFGLTEDSRHSPVFVSMQDVIADEGERWNLIANCPINREWSAGAGMFRGELRGWFCEIAMAQSLLMQGNPGYPDTGVPIPDQNGSLDWWQRTMFDPQFTAQARHHCHRCGVPMNGYGSLACADDSAAVEQTSAEYVEVYQLKRINRNLEVVTDREQLQEGRIEKLTHYLQNGQK